jgi:hypothetical protein
VKRSDDRWRRRRFPSLTAPPDRWAGTWGEWDSQDTVPRGPHLPYMVLRDGGPQPQWVGSPDQGADSRAQLAHPLGQLVEINTNILPLDLTLCFLTFGWHPLHHK